MKFSTILLIIFSLFFRLSGQIYADEKEYRVCDVYGSGIVTIPFSELQGYALDVLSEFHESPEIFVTNNTRGISKIINFHDNPQIVDVCPNAGDGNGAYYDIAINSQKELFITRKNGLLQKVNPENCAYQNITQIPATANNPSVLALSFDHQDNLYEGGWSSSVKRANAGNFQNWNVWHNFGGGNAAGDFVQIGDYIYVAWTQPNGKDYLFKVSLGPNNEYISHENLGQLMNETFGLAAEYGRLYGVTRSILYEIDLNSTPVENIPIFHHPNPSDYAYQWWGAAGLHEALDIKITFHRLSIEAENGTNQLSDPYTNEIPYEDIVYIRVHESTQGTTYIIPVRIIIDPAPAAADTGLTQCRDEETGYAEFHLNDAQSSINSNADNFAFFENLSDLQNHQNQLPLNYFIQSTQTLFVKVMEDDNDCFGIAELELIVPSADDINYDKNPAICMGTSIELTIPDVFVSYHWNGLSGNDTEQPTNTNSVTVSQPGEYSVTVTDSQGCTFKLPFHVGVGAGPQIVNILTEGNNFTVEVAPYGNYEYSLDGVLWQSSSTFTGAEGEEYLVYVRDMAGCRGDSYKFTFLNIPNFISPNDDGYNDVWKIRGLDNYPNAVIQIFDRFGKKFAERRFNGSGIIWDGKYMGEPVPSGTYWYIIVLDGDTKLTGHLTVKN